MIDASDLGKLAVDLQKSALAVVPATGVAVAAAGTKIVEQAQDDAPVRTGALRDDIQDQLVGPTTVDISIGTFYWYFQEYGTSKMAPHPFIGQNVDATVDWLVAEMQVVVDRINARGVAS